MPKIAQERLVELVKHLDDEINGPGGREYVFVCLIVERDSAETQVICNIPPDTAHMILQANARADIIGQTIVEETNEELQARRARNSD